MLAQLLFLLLGDGDPPGPVVDDLTCWNDALLNPVVDEGNADPQTLRKLAHSDLVRHRWTVRRNGVPMADPLDHGACEGLVFCAAHALVIQGLGDLRDDERPGLAIPEQYRHRVSGPLD